jgi:DNA-directed RNA polymerase specialized sigma24 family protein
MNLPTPHEPHKKQSKYAAPWSPETETREDVKALLLRRSALTDPEVLVFRKVYPDIYDTFLDTLVCVVRSHGAREAVQKELVHDAFMDLWKTCADNGLPDSIQAKLLGLATGLARNHVRRERNKPVTEALEPGSSKDVPGSMPRPEMNIGLKEMATTLFHLLTPEHQEAIDAVILRDLTVAAAARELNLPWSTVASRCTAALALLEEEAERLFTESERRL